MFTDYGMDSRKRGKLNNVVFDRYFPMTESARNAPKRDMMKLVMVKTWKMTEAKSSAARTSYR